MGKAEHHALRRLLLELFSPQELRQFLNKNFPRDVDQAVPWRESQSEVVSEVIRALESRGYTDESLRDALIKERPRRAQDIRQVWNVRGATVGGPAGAMSKRPEANGRARSWIGCLGIGAAIVVAGMFAVAAISLWGNSKDSFLEGIGASKDGDRAGKGDTNVVPKPSVSSYPAGGCPKGMAFISAGSFLMGSTVGKDREKPVRRVSVDAFCFDQSEVSRQAYSECRTCSESHATAKIHFNLKRSLKSYYDERCGDRSPGREHHPVTCVDLSQAKAYCQSLGHRLPTEEEWEFAARGPEGRTYPWGDEMPSAQHINACGIECDERIRKGRAPMFSTSNGAPTTAPVRSFLAGRTPRTNIYHLAGNVWEWTQSGYSERYDQERSQSIYVVRGGSWGSWVKADVRAAYRQAAKPTDRIPSLGFRCAADVR